MPYWAPRGLECPPGPPFPASLVPREPFGEDVNRPIYTDGSCLGDPVEGSMTGGPLGCSQVHCHLAVAVAPVRYALRVVPHARVPS